MKETPIRLAVIVGSTRERRFGHIVGRWVADRARLREDFDVDYIDLADIDLPLSLPRRNTEALEALVARFERADAFVVVTPEFNHGYPASLKQAIDLAYEEWNAKPVGFVSYGGISGGIRAVEQLRQVFAELHAVTIRDGVALQRAHSQFDASGDLLEPAGPSAAADLMLGQLAWWAEALRNARAAVPYAA